MAYRDEGGLIKAAQAGDGDAFEELVRRVQDRLFWIARQVVGNTDDARDVTQNVLIRLWKVLPRYDSKYAFSTWTYRMTVNMAIDHLRRAAPRQWDSELDERLVDYSDGVVGAPAGPDAAASEREVERIFEELRELLPPQQRAAFALREMEGLTSEETGEILGLSASTVRNHLFQARRTLKRELAERHPEYLPVRRPTAAGPGPEKAAKEKAATEKFSRERAKGELMRCPANDVLDGFVELELEPAVERGVREHLSRCSGCESRVLELEPSWLFARTPRKTLPDGEWADVLRAVRVEVAANPRVTVWRRVAEWLSPARLVPIGATLAVAALLVFSAGRPGNDGTLASGPDEQADDPLVEILAAAASAESAVATGFVYRSNPHAQVAEISVAGDGTDPIWRDPVQITMVVDENLADLF